jgi:hypothetical protein
MPDSLRLSVKVSGSCRLCPGTLYNSQVFYRVRTSNQCVNRLNANNNKAEICHLNTNFFSLALQPQFGSWPTSMKLSVSLWFSRS